MDRAQRQLTPDVIVPVGDANLGADLQIPPQARGLILFAHGSGSSRRSPRNRRVAAVLNEHGMGTMLIDLLTRNEETVDRITGQFRFDIELLAGRLVAAIDWSRRQPATAGLGIGCFGASTGGAAILIAAGQRPELVQAVVSRGGRVDLADRWLAKVKAATLLIVGAKDVEVVAVNQHALREIRAEKRLEVVAGATHLFEEPGALGEVAQMAAGWFTTFVSPLPDRRQ